MSQKKMAGGSNGNKLWEIDSCRCTSDDDYDDDDVDDDDDDARSILVGYTHLRLDQLLTEGVLLSSHPTVSFTLGAIEPS